MSEWRPRGLLEKCLVNYAHRTGCRSVIAVVSGAYAELIKRVDWRAANLAATLVAPIADSGCVALRDVPPAQGQAVAALLGGGLKATWRSSNSLPLRIENLCRTT